jgi:hypothetical protein
MWIFHQNNFIAFYLLSIRLTIRGNMTEAHTTKDAEDNCVSGLEECLCRDLLQNSSNSEVNVQYHAWMGSGRQDLST